MKTDFSMARFVVIGAGETGRSIVEFLHYHASFILRVLDTREEPPQINGVEVIGGKLCFFDLKDADVIVISPGVSIYEPALQEALLDGKLVIGDIELFALSIAHWNSKIIGITGSNGKTTVTSLTGYLTNALGKKTLIAGNIGTPVLNSWLEIEESEDYPDVIVLELSSFQLETIRNLKLDSATVLNISEDHLDRYRDLLEYAYIKANIFNNCEYQVLNSSDALVSAMSRHNKSKVTFAEKNAPYCLNNVDGKYWLQVNGENILDTNELQLVGRHNYLNVLASLALLAGIGISARETLPALVQFAGLEHRMQKVAEHNGVLFIEDSKGTNVGAVIAGVAGIDSPVHLILGGDGKGQDFSPLRQLVIDKCKSVAVIGQDAHLIIDALAGITKVTKYNSLQDAVISCIDNSTSGDAVILSPACASWDMFDNYKHRAQVFVDTIHEYIK